MRLPKLWFREDTLGFRGLAVAVAKFIIPKNY